MLALTSTRDRVADRLDGSDSWTDITRSALALIRSWRQRAGQRQCLAALDERLLRDIGVTRYDAAREAAKPFWR
jgi:uncharacterized protein YjiS (DUF1127 family)